MIARITTTITTDIDLDTFTPEHSTSVECSDDLPTQVIYYAVAGACKATLNSLPIDTDDEEADE